MLRVLRVWGCLRLRKKRVRLGELGGLRRCWLSNIFMNRIIILKKEKTALVVPEKQDIDLWVK